MASDPVGMESTPPGRSPKDGLSYKFQRLRERLRASVVGGEFIGRLPGERTLARRFHVNAKTLSKALTDLAAEGLLDRTIGRGTYVKVTSGGTQSASTARWLIVCDARCAESPLFQLLRQANPECGVIHDVSGVRPSLLKQYDAVVDFSADTPERFLHDLVVRNVPVAAINREPGTFSINTVGVDCALGAHALARDFILGGHRQIAVIESAPRSVAGKAAQQAALRYGGGEATVRVYGKGEVDAATAAGATAIICDTTAGARQTRGVLEAAGVRVPADVSLAAVGCVDGELPCSGQYVEGQVLVDNVAELLRSGTNHRPSVIWLAPRWVDQGTTRVLPHRTIGGEAA